jgi:hypothetical protein
MSCAPQTGGHRGECRTPRAGLVFATARFQLERAAHALADRDQAACPSDKRRSSPVASRAVITARLLDVVHPCAREPDGPAARSTVRSVGISSWSGPSSPRFHVRAFLEFRRNDACGVVRIVFSGRRGGNESGHAADASHCRATGADKDRKPWRRTEATNEAVDGSVARRRGPALRRVGPQRHATLDRRSHPSECAIEEQAGVRRGRSPDRGAFSAPQTCPGSLLRHEAWSTRR